MDVLLTCKNEEDPIKTRGARVSTTLYINFSDVQGQITLVFVVVSGQNWNSSKLSCMSLLPARMRLIKLKMEELECSQDFSHYKSMGIFPDAQGQLTLQCTVRSGQISNLFETLWLSSLPAKMKKIRPKIEALECSQHYTSRADNSGVGGDVWQKFELIQAYMHVLVTCKNEDDRLKIKELEQDFSNYKSMGFFPDAQGQRTPTSLVRSGRISNSSEIL